MEFLEFRTSEIASAGCRSLQLSLVVSSLRQTATRGQLAMMLHNAHPLSILACARAYSFARGT